MRSHLHDPAFIARLNSFQGLGYAEYPFPVSSLYLFGDDESLRFAFFGCHMTDARALNDIFTGKVTASVRRAMEYLDAYLAKRETALPPLDLTPFTKKEGRVYDALLGVEFGKTVSYGELARRSGMPRAARFAGNCMAKNVFPVFIPCHRVINGDGSMGNYSAGLEIKRFLLTHESRRRS